MKEKSVITIEAKEEIRKNIAELKEVLKDDKEFAQELVDKILSLGQGVYGNDVDTMIGYYKYNPDGPTRDPYYSEHVELKIKISKIWGKLEQIMDDKNFSDRENLKDISYKEFRDTLFEDTLDEIYDAFYENTVESLNVADMNLMGE